MKPFYQGNVDSFCAIYAVLNALRLTHGIRMDKARSIFADTFLWLARSPDVLRSVFEQTTDYVFLIDHMLKECERTMRLRVEKPFADTDRPSVDFLWECCRHWMNADRKRSILIRFFRYIMPNTNPSVRHWSTIQTIDEDILHLYDSSHDAEAIMNLQRKNIVTDIADLSQNVVLYVQPSSLRFLSLP